MVLQPVLRSDSETAKPSSVWNTVANAATVALAVIAALPALPAPFPALSLDRTLGVVVYLGSVVFVGALYVLAQWRDNRARNRADAARDAERDAEWKRHLAERDIEWKSFLRAELAAAIAERRQKRIQADDPQGQQINVGVIETLQAIDEAVATVTPGTGTFTLTGHPANLIVTRKRD